MTSPPFLPSPLSCPLPDRPSRIMKSYTALDFIADLSDLPGTGQSRRFALVLGRVLPPHFCAYDHDNAHRSCLHDWHPPPPCLRDWPLPLLTHQPPPSLRHSKTRSEALVQVPGTYGGLGRFFFFFWLSLRGGSAAKILQGKLWWLDIIARQRLSQVSCVLLLLFSTYVGKLSICTQMGQFHASPRISMHMHRMSFHAFIL